MILGAFETMLDRTPPAWMRKAEVAALMKVFADAFDVDPPVVDGLSADEALTAFREFTFACMDAALQRGDMAEEYRMRLGAGAHELGRAVRRAVPVRASQVARLVRFFYRGIGIELAGELPGNLTFGPCSFAQRYTPRACWLMSAFDEGFMRGVAGTEGNLEFSCRLTEGAPCCRARFG